MISVQMWQQTTRLFFSKLNKCQGYKRLQFIKPRYLDGHNLDPVVNSKIANWQPLTKKNIVLLEEEEWRSANLFGNCEAMERVEQLTLLLFTFLSKTLSFCAFRRDEDSRYLFIRGCQIPPWWHFVLISRNYAGTQTMKINFKWKGNFINSSNVCWSKFQNWPAVAKINSSHVAIRLSSRL